MDFGRVAKTTTSCSLLFKRSAGGADINFPTICSSLEAEDSIQTN